MQIVDLKPASTPFKRAMPLFNSYLLTLVVHLQTLKILIAQREENEEQMSRQTNVSRIFTSLKAHRLLTSLSIFFLRI